VRVVDRPNPRAAPTNETIKMKFHLVLVHSAVFAFQVHAQTVKELQAEIVSLQAQVAALQSSSVQALAPFVSVDPNPENGVAGPNVVISGVNVHIVNGTRQTATVNGLGNLIIGYDELPPNAVEMQNIGRGGSHNLVVGRYNQFGVAGFGNLVGGEWNDAASEAGFVVGLYNETSGAFSSISGGVGNWAGSEYSSVCGGEGDWSLGICSVVLGGYYNKEYGSHSVTVGGYNQTDASTAPEFGIDLQ